VHEIDQGSKPPKMNTQVSALRFFLKITLGRLDLAHQLARVDYPRKLPRVLSPADVARLLEAAPGPGDPVFSLRRGLMVSTVYGDRRAVSCTIRMSIRPSVFASVSEVSLAGISADTTLVATPAWNWRKGGAIPFQTQKVIALLRTFMYRADPAVGKDYLAGDRRKHRRSLWGSYLKYSAIF
jgi:hypothetical protein